MLEGIVADVLVRVLGSYVDGLNRESIRVGVWQGDLELNNLRIRPDALAILFETLGLDLPVTVTAGYIGHLRLEVPWKTLRSAPVRIFMRDVNVVASPVSDGDQSALELRERRLKAARLSTDDAVRDAKFSVRSELKSQTHEGPSLPRKPTDPPAMVDPHPQPSGYLVTRWGWRFTRGLVTRIIDNILIDVENVIVQYEDASSVRDNPYTATIGIDSLRACSTDHQWNRVFIDRPDSPVIHKVLYACGVVLNWEPGSSTNGLREWILDSDATRTPGHWSGLVREGSRHAIRPMDGELRVALTKGAALASAIAGTNTELKDLQNAPRVQMDIHFPDVHIALDDFQYHTLLSTIMYLSDIDRKVRPKTARGRWFWALDRLLPRFKERHEAAKQFNADGLRRRRETRERYCRARNALVKARRNGQSEPSEEARIIEQLETELCFHDIIHFRDLAERELYLELRQKESSTSSSRPRFWSMFSRTASTASLSEPLTSNPPTNESSGPEVTTQPHEFNPNGNVPPLSIETDASECTKNVLRNTSNNGEHELNSTVAEVDGTEGDEEDTTQGRNVPNFRMGFLLGRGAIELRRGGFCSMPVPISSLEFRELRLGVETRADARFLIEALLGTFEVVDLRSEMSVMYQRVPWAGENVTKHSDIDSDSCVKKKDSIEKSHAMSQYAEEWLQARQIDESHTVNANDSESCVPVLPSYPYGVADALAEIRGEFGVESPSVPVLCPRFSPYRSSAASDSSSSPSVTSEGGLSSISALNREDLSMTMHAPLKYIAALRLNQEEAPDGDWASGSTRMAMDLAIGGMEVILDGPESAFVSSVKFWHPREKAPSIMKFLTRAAAPKLASLRMNIQKAILERSVPMRMDILVRAPRFVLPGPRGQEVSILLDLGTFAMDTSIGTSESFSLEPVNEEIRDSKGEDGTSQNNQDKLSVRYTHYQMACTDLGLYVVSEAGRHAAERIVKPFSVHLLLEVLNNSSYIEAMVLKHGDVDIAKVKLQGKLPSLRTSVSHQAFRQILDIVKSWGDPADKRPVGYGTEPTGLITPLPLATEMEQIRQFQDPYMRQLLSRSETIKSPLIAFEMSLDLNDLQLELRDSSSRRIVTISSTGTYIQMRQRTVSLDFDYSVRSFTVVDGSRGATAPFRRLMYAGIGNRTGSVSKHRGEATLRSSDQKDSRSFITLSYHGDKENHEQNLGVKILSLNLVFVRESYFALADFFYLNDGKRNACSNGDSDEELDHILPSATGDNDQVRAEYSDPFSALGMTTSGAAKALRLQAERGMEISKQAIADRGRMSVSADLDGLNMTLVTAEGAIACFDVTECKTHLLQHSDGAVEASGDLGGFGIRDLTSSYDVYAETIRYNRRRNRLSVAQGEKSDGWSLVIPSSEGDDIELKAVLRNMRIVYLHRFIVILKKYFDVLRQSLKPVLEMKGGLGEVFDSERGEDFPAFPTQESRVNLSIVTENVDIIMPRHSQSPYEALRFFVPRSSISNVPIVAPGYQLGFNVQADDVDAYVLYQAPAEGEGRALTEGGTEPTLRHIELNDPVENLTPFSRDISIVAKLDLWRRRRVPEVVLNADGLPTLKDGEEEREYDPNKWLPAIRVRISAPNGIVSRLCEAEYSILYFTFTENVIERPDIEFTDLVRGLKTPVLPARRPVQPIMFSSNKMPPNYQIIFEVPSIISVIMSGADPQNEKSKLIRSELRDIVGLFEYGVDYRMTVEISGNLCSLVDARPGLSSNGKTLVTPVPFDTHEDAHGALQEIELSRSITFTWDRPFGFRTNVMIVVSNLRIIIDPELFRDLGCLTAPGFPYLKSSAPPPLIRFNGRLLIVTVSRPEVWLMCNQFPGDGRSLVIRGEIIAKVQWAAVTGRQMVEVSARGMHVNLSNVGPSYGPLISPSLTPSSRILASVFKKDRRDVETPMLYPCDISMRFDESGYDPPEKANGEPVKILVSNLSINAESFLVRLDVNDAPLILGVGSRLIRLKSSDLSRRPVQPGRFDQWIDKGEDGDGKLAVHFVLPNGRLMFTDETAGRYVPIMEARVRNVVLKSNVPWLTNAAFEFALELFNNEKGWWEPGIEMFPVEIAASIGRSGSRAMHVHIDRNIDINITPNTASGAARVSKALKSAVSDLKNRLHQERLNNDESVLVPQSMSNSLDIQAIANAKRPSVAAFCVRNDTGRAMVMWLPYDSKRRSLHGDGDEIEVDPPSEEVLWSAIGTNSHGFVSTDPNKNRQLSMSCILSLSGYTPKTLSTIQIGTWLVSLKPDLREISSPTSSNESKPMALTLVWSVAMRDGVPCGCIRSVLRLVNRTKTVLEVNISGFRRSASVGEALKAITGVSGEASHDSAVQNDLEPHGLVKAGESWSIPIHAIHRAIRIRPVIFNAPDNDATSDHAFDSQMKERVYYAYKWSEPLSKISTLHEVGRELCVKNRKRDATSRVPDVNASGGPVLTCRAQSRRHVFTMMLHPKIDSSVDWDLVEDREVPGWVDIRVCPPLVLENLLPRPLYFKLATPIPGQKEGAAQVMEESLIEPLREAHVHTAGSKICNIALAVGVDNSPSHETCTETSRTRSVRNVGDFLPNLSALKTISMGTGKYQPFVLKIDQDKTVTTRHIRVFCSFWIRNRSDTDLFFRDMDTNRESKEHASPKVFLRGRAPGTPADKYICFSGKWLSLQRADATEDVWLNVNTEVHEIDKPIPLQFDGLSLILEVRPAKGKLMRSLIATIRNAVWIENRTCSVLQWCQPASLNAQGIALSSRVHNVKRGEIVPLHWDIKHKKKAICLRRATDNGTSEWIWSRPVNVEGVEGEFVAKMYRPKRLDQYIARVTITRLGYGVLGIVIHREDRNTPPYRIVNNCVGRSIAFKQSGVHETHPWLVRPGKSTRYSWDDPQAPVKKRALVVEVIEVLDVYKKSNLAALSAPSKSDTSNTSQHLRLEESLSVNPDRTKEVRYQKFDLNIDMISKRVPIPHASRFDPPLMVSVHVDGPTKVVTFSDLLTQYTSQPSENCTIDVARNETPHFSDGGEYSKNVDEQKQVTKSLDIEIFVNALGVSFVDSTPTELAYLSVTGIHFRLDRFDGQQLLTCDIRDLQLDNQLVRCPWPVVVWSPPVVDSSTSSSSSATTSTGQRILRKPFFQLIIDGPFPSVSQGIGTFRGIFIALQQLQIAADEDFVLRIWLFATSLVEAIDGSGDDKNEPLGPRDGLEQGIPLNATDDNNQSDLDSPTGTNTPSSQRLKRLYVEQLELCPLKLNVSFTSSRTSTAAEQIGGFRSLMRTLVAVLGNVENAEFRFNALELSHMFDSISHFRSLITEYYVAQGSNQKIVLLASNSLIGNPSALFDSIAIGTRDFFVEPANAKGSADFVASIGRGSSSLLTNTVGGLVGSIGAIPRAVAQGLETAVGDRDYLAERDSIRGGRARAVSSPAQGLVTGALSFGHGIASAAAGLIRDPIQGAAEEGASGFIKGLGKGFIGGVLKPITGALDLIAEPAAGLRSMMVSDRGREYAEPVRPSRAFWGAHNDQMASYDLRDALGQAILGAVNGAEQQPDERLVSWTYLVAVHHNTNDAQVVSFLWALMRQSTRSTFRGKFLMDAQGKPQQAGKMRSALITTKRLIVTSLDGHVLWEYPLADVLDTQVSLEAKDFLMVGVRPVGHRSRDPVAPYWKKIHCGSMHARDELNASLRKVIQERRLASDTLYGYVPTIQRPKRPRLSDELQGDRSSNAHKEFILSDAGGQQVDRKFIEMADLSKVGVETDPDGQSVELKSLHYDTSADGRRGIFTNQTMPGRGVNDNPAPKLNNSAREQKRTSNLTLELEKVISCGSVEFMSSAPRSICIFIVNELQFDLYISEANIESGRWVRKPPNIIEAQGVVKLEADCGDDRVQDILGSMILSMASGVSGEKDDTVCAIRFLNPLLTTNAYAISNTSWMSGSFKGGKNENKAVTVLTLREGERSTQHSTSTDMGSVSRKNTTVDPLLFGRSSVPTLQSTFPIEPPHAPKGNGNPTDPELVAKLASLGFSEEESRKALTESNADVSAAYANLVKQASPKFS